jgi:hypothetical protein
MNQKEKYDLYLHSQEWRDKVAALVLKTGGKRCAKCGTKYEVHTHHKTYARIFNEDLDDLIFLCRTHHFEEHERRVASIDFQRNGTRPAFASPSTPKPRKGTGSGESRSTFESSRRCLPLEIIAAPPFFRTVTGSGIHRLRLLRDRWEPIPHPSTRARVP